MHLNIVTDERGDARIKDNNKQHEMSLTKLTNEDRKGSLIKEKSDNNLSFKQQPLPEQQLQPQQPELSEEDMLMLMTENEELFQSMSSMVDEVTVCVYLSVFLFAYLSNQSRDLIICYYDYLYILSNLFSISIKKFVYLSYHINAYTKVHVIEGQVVEISQLQELFTEKILEQEVDIDRIAGAVVGSSEDISMANDVIREVGVRVLPCAEFNIYKNYRIS